MSKPIHLPVSYKKSNKKMRNILIGSIIITLFVSILLINTVASADWPMINHDEQHTSYSSDEQPINFTLRWVYTATGMIGGSPSIVDGIAYFGDSADIIYAVNVTTGLQIWNHTEISGPQIITSTPAVSNGIVYLGGFHDIFYALNATTGEEIWKWDPEDAGIARSGPVVSNNNVFYLSDSGILYSLNATTGASLWNFTEASGASVADSSPAAVNNVIYVGVDNQMYAVNESTGAKIWNYTVGSDIYSSPTVSNNIVYFTSEDTKVYALNTTDGSQLWNYTTTITAGSTAIANGVVYLSDDFCEGYALNATTGAEIWHEDWGGGTEVMGAPTVINGTFYIGAYSGDLAAINTTNGAVIWIHDGINGTYFGEFTCTAAISDGFLYATDLDGNLWSIGLLPEELPPSTGGTYLRPTYYFRSDTYTTNGVSGFGLDSDFTNTKITITDTIGG